MKELILIKLGGSVITDKKRKFTAHGKTILRIAREIKKARKIINKTHFIIGHGSGSFGHTPAAKYKTKDGIINKDSVYGMALTEDAARRLNMIVVNNFLREKLPVFSFSPASFLVSDAEINRESYLDPIKNALLTGAIPVVYGDVIMDTKIGCTIFSTEKVFSILAKELGRWYKIRAIYCTDVDGVYDKNGKTIPVISGKNFDLVKKSILGAKGVDVTGGMLHKVEESLAILKKYDISTLIINGAKPGNLEKAIRNREVLGTKIQI